MSEAIAEAPPVAGGTTVAAAPKTSKEAGTKGLAERFAEVSKANDAKSKAAPKGEAEGVVEVADVELRGLLAQMKSQEKKPEDKTEVVKEPADKTKLDWKTVKGERDQFETEAKTLRTQLEEFKAKAIMPERLTAAEKRAEELESKLEIQNLEGSEKFAREFTQPKIELVDQAKALATEVLGADDVVTRAMNLTGKARREFLDEAFADQSPSALAEMAGLLTSIDTLERRKATALTHWKQQRDQMSEAERATAMREAADERNAVVRAFDAQLQTIATKLPQYREVTGDDAHNAQRQANIEYARKLATGEASLEDMASAPYLAVIAGEIIKGDAEKNATIEKLTLRLKQYENAAPALNGGSGGANGNGESTGPMGMLERIRRGV